MKILFLTRFDFTESKKDGGILATDRNYKLLSQIYGEDNIILCILTEKVKEDKGNIHYFKSDKGLIKTYIDYVLLKERISYVIERKLVKFISQQNIDCIFYDGSTFGQIIKHRVVSNMKSIVFFHNVERQYTWEQVKKHSWFCIFRYLSTRYNERKMIKYGKKIICLNERDNNLVQRFYKRNADFLLPITFDDTVSFSNDIKNECNNELLYVGSYFAHNYTGLMWFIENVMPHVNVKLVVVGKNMEKLKNKMAIPNKVEIIGTVDELSQFYNHADAMVMPIFMGGGMKVKTAEALMYGKTIFASKEALEGYDVTDVKNIYQCNTKEEFINSINEFFKKNNINKMNKDVRKLFLSKYCTDNYKDSMYNFLKNI